MRRARRVMLKKCPNLLHQNHHQNCNWHQDLPASRQSTGRHGQRNLPQGVQNCHTGCRAGKNATRNEICAWATKEESATRRHTSSHSLLTAQSSKTEGISGAARAASERGPARQTTGRQGCVNTQQSPAPESPLARTNNVQFCCREIDRGRVVKAPCGPLCCLCPAQPQCW